MKIILVLLVLGFMHGCTFRPPVTSGTVTSSFGPRANPVGEGHHFHWGTDIGLPVGVPISPVASGTVTRVGYNEARGNYIFISHFVVFSSRYIHLDEVNVEVGERVNHRIVIGTSGATGRVTGPHLHYEIRLFGIPKPPHLFIIPGRILTSLGIVRIAGG